MAQTRAKQARMIAVSILALGIAGYTGILYIGFGVSSSGLIQNKLHQSMQLSDLYYAFLYAHIVTGIIAIGTGWIQFLDSFRNKFPAWHGRIGRVYSYSVLFSGLSGILISFQATGGWISTVGFLLLSLLWLYTLGKGLRAVAADRDIARHRRWMLRNYSLTFAAVTLRIYLPICMLLFGFEAFDDYYRAIAWLCWVPNLLFAEWWIRRSPAFRISLPGPGTRVG